MTSSNQHSQTGTCGSAELCSSRRQFLIGSGAVTSLVLLKSLFPGRVASADAERSVQLVAAGRVQIGRLSELQADKPIIFRYPQDGPFCDCMLVKLGKRAGGGIGPEQDVVAFNTWCTHMGSDLAGEYNAQHKVAGPCREHLTTFDLIRHGMVVAGHATAALPQIVLELEGDDIVATGVIGLIYGYHQNPTATQEGQVG